MMARFIHNGDAIDYAPETDTPAGTVVVVGDLIGVAKLDIKAGELGVLHVRGVFDFPKATGAGSGSGMGVNIYWDEGDQIATQDSDSGTNKLLGKAIAAAIDSDLFVRVRMT
ncbi:hypothetical protein KS4_10840 [Poriferisphaera corsica]|uniref:DUF2190 family protein n=1 Tax=Poriferisphaera corsica TaxID=2528020 RepID=A0A517YS47_9BACT|nr:DUF2190 family protein [Poriferisphaera corsica]QDU33043.1 hypothetical protein KS4_10840 [Poriferisphaera corsica]